MYKESEPPLVPSGPLMVIALEVKVLVLPAQLPVVDQLPGAKLPEKSARALSSGATNVIPEESKKPIKKYINNLFLITSNYTR